MSRPEILAPAGSVEALTAALRCGADAVYLGTQQLNARRLADNFDDEALCRAAYDCHTHGAKLYLTLNTLAADSELRDVSHALETAAAAGVDALIVQDMGVARMAREMCDIPLHASTQTSVQTSAGVSLLEQAGFTRVVIPREMQREEIKTLRQETALEIEMFVHGALCMCISGQCLMSAVFGGRSGNRGLCAQPCRLPFSASGGTGHDLSLRDLSLIGHLREIAQLGVDSLKIEGRMKRPEYVAAAVTACKKALDGADGDEIFDALRRVFSRSGFTDGYYTGKRGRAMFGTRQKEDVTAASSVLDRLRTLYADVPARYPADFLFVCRAQEPISLTAACAEHSCTVKGDVPAIAQNKALNAETVHKQLAKCGGTLFFAQSVQTQIDDGLFLPASALNALRRRALDGLLNQIAQRPAHHFRNVQTPYIPHVAAKPKVYARFADEKQIPSDACADKIILPLWCAAQTIAAHDAAVEIPRGLLGREEPTRRALLECRSAGVREAFCGTLDALALALDCGLAPTAGFGSNLFNTAALAQWADFGAQCALLSPELTLAQVQQLGGTLPRGVWAYGRLPLMLTRNCPQQNGKTCAECRRSGYLTDRKGVTFPIECRSGFAEILNSRPVYLADKQPQIRAADFLLLYFTTENAAECAHILEAFRTQEPPRGDFTRGMALRGVE